MKIDKKLIKELVENLNEFQLTELEYQEGDKKIKVSKWTPPSVEKVSTNVKSNTTKAVFNDDEIGTRIKSPIIGTAYLSPEPGAKQFIKVGDNVKKGQTIMIVEAMKTMNHIPSSGDGDVKEILVKDGQPVEFGQTLVLLK
jgi:acetyl-CoA carboxylase biotin carboxyl carrier protein